MRRCPGSTARGWLVAAGLLLLLAPGPGLARGLGGGWFASGRSVMLKVMARSVPVRAGPGGSYREVGRVGQGQVYEALDRSPDGAWYRIRLSRATSGWVLTELVWPFELADEDEPTSQPSWLFREVLGPSILGEDQLCISVGAGALDRDGFFLVRLGYQPSPHYLLEVLVGQSAGRLGGMLLYGGELVVTVGPWRTLTPFAALGGGGATSLPNREGRLLSDKTYPMLMAGGGLLLAFQDGITFRVDVRETLTFDAEQSWALLMVTGGLMWAF
ncbi:MAG TPA: SH3 domain-containing protein [Myxococcota bacterium]|nr:SH3 domain-containing protein [Myxococcota bacterium]HRY94120.1 SH3 domain-containing protein [Myxococcota bacterium]HSA22917.1 SH3 domain-containing protein [Myxococcota bacterium]